MKILRFGMVGGGGNAFIGGAHRRGAQMDDAAVLSAGCFSRRETVNRQTGEDWRVPSDRVYADWHEMAARESARSDGIDFVVIATPNNTHYEIAKCFLEHGIHVSCDKPVAMNVSEAATLRALAQEKGLHCGVSYTYVNYPLVHQLRAMADAGEIGKIVNVVAEYPQDWVIAQQAAGVETEKAWRFDSRQAGPSACAADIGTHLECLIHFATGLHVERVLARLSHIPAKMPLETDAQVLLELSGGVPGLLWASQVAFGHDCGVSVRVFGDKGALEWTHDDPNHLKFTRAGGPVQLLTSAAGYLKDGPRAMSRLAAGHPEGFFEAFGNYYRAFCREVWRCKGATDAPSLPHPTIEDGIRGLRFSEACIESQRRGNAWIQVS